MIIQHFLQFSSGIFCKISKILRRPGGSAPRTHYEAAPPALNNPPNFFPAYATEQIDACPIIVWNEISLNAYQNKVITWNLMEIIQYSACRTLVEEGRSGLFCWHFLEWNLHLFFSLNYRIENFGRLQFVYFSDWKIGVPWGNDDMISSIFYVFPTNIYKFCGARSNNGVSGNWKNVVRWG